MRENMHEIKKQMNNVNELKMNESRRLATVLGQLQSETARADGLQGRVKVLSAALSNLSNEKSALQSEKKDLQAIINSLKPS
mmetsp:Transcript_13394/g.13451  ORF Transcript_13394/g.13451 Transcript_13394/m.13451 type:complete len:82 (+) Transcript_13394:512-757(+)